jgi:alkylation response protein AidB-like acyl-CoA dehydrogenase
MTASSARLDRTGIGTDTGRDKGTALDLELTGDQELLRATTRAFLERESPLTRVRELIDDSTGFDPKAWAQGAELGWFALLAPEENGGGSISGNGVHDLTLIAAELGRMLFPGPVLATNLVAYAIANWGSPAQRARHLSSIVAGDTVASWAFAEPDDRWDGDGISVTAARDGDSFRLDGVKSVVQDAHVADVLLVVARSDAGLVQVLVPTATPGVSVEPLHSLDLTRRFATVRFDRAHVPADAALEGGTGAVEGVLQLAAVLQCAETVGSIDRIFELTREYALDRVAFGRPIGSFQAIKHQLAEMLGWIESSKAVTGAAAAAVHRRIDAAELASAAKSYVGTHAPLVTRGCLQVHGGIGYTWEHDLHLYLRRVESNRALYGSPEQHLDRLATIIGL